MKPTKWLISVSAVILLVGHLVRPDLRIDHIATALLLIAILPWLGSLLKELKLPGGFEISYQDLDVVERKVIEAGLPASTPSSTHSAYVEVLEPAGSAAASLVILRSEIERRLRELADREGLSRGKSRIGSTRLIRELTLAGVLSGQLASALADVQPLLNAAAHGATVDPAAMAWSMEVGPVLLESLDRVLDQPSRRKPS